MFATTYRVKEPSNHCYSLVQPLRFLLLQNELWKPILYHQNLCIDHEHETLATTTRLQSNKRHDFIISLPFWAGGLADDLECS